uniref:GB1/RHD3-type G domain-containing protein n=1 Tax=Strigamia maritima TaxID=126957 RepID=T1J6A7_STRMM
MSAQQIISVNTDGTYRLNSQLLQTILTREDVKNERVAIICAAGPARKGKSFLLNFFLRYFQHKRSADWLRVNLDEHLDGFNWTKGSEGVTTGIWLWSEPLKMSAQDGGQICVFLMDTQGINGNENLLALSTVLATVTLYNSRHGLKQNDIEIFHAATERGINAVENENPVQKLIFLIRDWGHAHAHSFGFEGGNEYLEAVRENHELNNTLGQHFTQLSSFLMPYPGDVISEDDFEGQVKLIEGEFVKSLDKLIPGVVNEIEVNTVLRTGQDVYKRFNDYFAALMQ